VLASGTQDRKIAGSLPTEAVGFFVMEKSTARSTIGRERTIEHKEHETNKQGKKNKKNPTGDMYVFLLCFVR
jgi:hypothetical protein